MKVNACLLFVPLGKKNMMKYTIGIPQALLYYKQFPFWKTFFNKLGAEIALSETTNSRIMELGLQKCLI